MSCGLASKTLGNSVNTYLKQSHEGGVFRRLYQLLVQLSKMIAALKDAQQLPCQVLGVPQTTRKPLLNQLLESCSHTLTLSATIVMNIIQPVQCCI